MNFDATNFGMRIQEVRLRRGITQEQLAGEIDMARENLSRVECGARACSLEYLIRIAIALDVSTDYLLLGKETDNQGWTAAVQNCRQGLFNHLGEL